VGFYRQVTTPIINVISCHNVLLIKKCIKIVFYVTAYIMTVRGEVSANKTSLPRYFFNCEIMYLCIRGIDFVSDSTLFRLYVVTVLVVWYFLFVFRFIRYSVRNKGEGTFWCPVLRTIPVFDSVRTTGVDVLLEVCKIEKLRFLSSFHRAPFGSFTSHTFFV